MRFRADSTGKVAIYEPGAGGSDDVFDDPYVDLSRVVWHTDLVLRGYDRKQTISVRLAPGPNVSISSRTVIFTHGLGIIPYVEADLLNWPNNGDRTPWAGMIPIMPLPTNRIPGLLGLAWDDDKVYAVWYHGPDHRVAYDLNAELRIGSWEVPQ